MKRSDQILAAMSEEPDHDRRFHLVRTDAGARHYNKDVTNAPWTDERVPGQCYCSLRPCPLV